nr:uncharacterized protein LOC131756823 [Kogia breviceps]
MHKAHSQLRRYIPSIRRACNQCKRHSCYLPQLIGAPLGGPPHLGSLLGQVAGSWTLTQHRTLCPRVNTLLRCSRPEAGRGGKQRGPCGAQGSEPRRVDVVQAYTSDSEDPARTFEGGGMCRQMVTDAQTSQEWESVLEEATSKLTKEEGPGRVHSLPPPPSSWRAADTPGPGCSLLTCPSQPPRFLSSECTRSEQEVRDTGVLWPRASHLWAGGPEPSKGLILLRGNLQNRGKPGPLGVRGRVSVCVDKQMCRIQPGHPVPKRHLQEDHAQNVPRGSHPMKRMVSTFWKISVDLASNNSSEKENTQDSQRASRMHPS